jgi:hypothetical protein
MSDQADISRYIKDPSLLVELCREVIDQLDAGSEEVSVVEQEAQLRAIAKAVEQLEKAGVAVPDPLRAEKTRLAASLSIHTDAKQALAHLADEFQDILHDLLERLGQNPPALEPKPRGKRSNLPKTPKKVLREHILRALKKFGGRARAGDVLDQIERQLEGKLLEGDLAIRRDGKTLAWRNNAQWERLRMRHEGILRADSPNGIWELEEGHQ